MNEEPTAPDSGLHEFVDAEFTVQSLDSPSREKALHDALENLSGLENLTINRGKVTAHYEPVLLSRKQLEEAIRGAGFQVSETHASSASPLTDVFGESEKSREEST